MRQRGFNRNRRRADLGLRTEAEIDAENIALGIDAAKRLDNVAGITLRRFSGVIAFTAGKQRGIIKQDRIDVR